MFLKPIKGIALDLVFFFLISLGCIYGLLFLIKDSTIAMIGVVWVGIIAWRGGVLAGLLGSVAIALSVSAAISLPPHLNIEMPYYFNNRLPGFALGLLQSIIVAAIVGYISSLIHRLRKEIHLREKTQKELELRIAELDVFGHTVAHDLKNPLTAINMSVTCLQKELSSTISDKTSRMLEFISDGARQMITIIESILVLAGLKKIDQNKFSRFQIAESVNEALKRLEFSIESDDVKLKLPDGWPSVFGYPQWVNEVWMNYISNAIKYGGKPKQGIKPVIELGYDPPHFECSGNTEFIRFWVRDNGDGIPADKVDGLFEEFTRVDTTAQAGSGLGLSIVKMIINRFNGTVGVESEVGKGSLFFFTLPTEKPLKN